MKDGLLVLAIETSCDETAAAIVAAGYSGATKPRLLSSAVYSQIQEHKKTRGVVPEVASRAHTDKLDAVIDEAVRAADIALSDITHVAVTNAPGLTGSLLAGVTYAKALAISLGRPLIPVNHLVGHIYSNLIERTSIHFPAVVLIASGGHTSLVFMRDEKTFVTLGSTIDDAAGEAFDKVAALMDAGYPGGPAVARLADQYDGSGGATIDLPRPMIDSGDYDFSFSGLKTAVLYAWRDLQDADQADRISMAHAFQEAAVDVLVAKTISAALNHGAKTIMLCGGVAANKRLRERLQYAANQEELQFVVPAVQYCGDNAAMIGFAAASMIGHNTYNTYDFPVLSQQPIDAS